MHPNAPIPVRPGENLPVCSWRGKSVTTETGKPRLECSHPKLLSHGDLGLVHPQQCFECKYANWEPESFLSQYSQGTSAMPTRDEFAARLQACNGCFQRAGNYCTLLKTCSLARILQRPGTTCPIGKFTAILRDVMTEQAPNESPAQIARRNERLAREQKLNRQLAGQAAVKASVMASRVSDLPSPGPQGAALADQLAKETPIAASGEVSQLPPADVQVGEEVSAPAPAPEIEEEIDAEPEAPAK